MKTRITALLAMAALFGVVMDYLHPLPAGEVMVAFPWAIIPLAISAISSFMHKNPQQTQGSQTTTSTSTPSFGPEFSPLLTQVMGLMKDRLNTGGLPAGYEAKGLSDINHSADLIRGGLNRRLAASGQLGGPSDAAAQGTLEGQRLGSVSDFLTETPIKEREMQGQDLAQALGLLGMGRGSSTTSTGTQTGTFNPGGPGQVATGMGDISQLLAYLISSGAFKSAGSNNTGAGMS